jgi:endonuclease-3
MERNRFDATIRELKRRYREPAASSKDTPWEVILFTALSARTRDDQTEPAFRRLLARYPTIPALAKAKVGDVGSILKTIGLYRTKAKNVVALAQTLVERHAGKVPADLDALVELPAVGRKTASCVLVYAFGIPAVAVDTHVHRIANRLGWAKAKDPVGTERDLRRVLPRKHWLDVNRVMVSFGRDVCVPGVPKCWKCPVSAWCAFPKKTPAPKDPKQRQNR